MPPRAATMPLLLRTGQWDEVEELAFQTLQDGSPLERQMAITMMGQILRYRGDPRKAWQMVREILPRGSASEPEDALFPYAMETMRLAIRLSLDGCDPELADEWVRAHDRWMSWSGAVRGNAESLVLHSEIFRQRGALDEAENAAVEAVSVASEPWQPLALIEAERILGRVLACRQRYQAAEAHLQRAIELSTLCELPVEEAVCRVELADAVYRETGAFDQIARVLETARTQAEAVRARPLLERIDTLLSEENRFEPLTVLSRRELEVLRAIASGMTDAEAADSLYISPRTVSQHMRSVYNKLGVSSRAAATRWAVENGLV